MSAAKKDGAAGTFAFAEKPKERPVNCRHDFYEILAPMMPPGLRPIAGVPGTQGKLGEPSAGGEAMEGLRVVQEPLTPRAPCCRCQSAGCPWDRLAGQPICPDCQEALAQGEGEPFVVRTEKHRCAVCQQSGTVRYLTYPLHSSEPVEMDLCPRHFQALLARRLDKHAYHQLSRQLQTLGFSTRQVFLLHEAFYDEQGRSLQPVPEW